MKEVLYNYDNLTKDDIEEVVTRTKCLIINSSNELLLGYSNKTYQFPGGHLEKGESLLECLKREVREETGIEIDTKDLYPFEKITFYTKNYRNSGKNRCNDLYFFVYKTDEDINYDKMSLTEDEKEGNFKIVKIPMDKVEQVLIDNAKDNPINEVIVEEMLDVIREYKKNSK